MPTMDLDHVDPTLSPRTSRRGHPSDVRSPALTSASALAKANPDFEVPSDAQVRALEPGSWVKVARNGERFWVKMTGYVGRKYHGIVANTLDKNADLPTDTPIFFLRRHIYCIRP
jgi:hypothetical protein